MDNQPLMPTSPTPFSSPRSGGGGPLIPILIGLLALGAVAFGILAMVFYNQASTATKTLDAQKAEAVAKAKAEQKKADDEAYTIAAQSPYRAYTAPVEYGSFVINFPKTWSSDVIQQRAGTQITLMVNPDFIRTTNGQQELLAAKVLLIERPSDQYLSSFNALVKKGTLKQSEMTVSDLKAYNLTGQFADKRSTRQVVVPVRDKVLVFINENGRYNREFNEILAQAKIVP